MEFLDYKLAQPETGSARGTKPEEPVQTRIAAFLDFIGVKIIQTSLLVSGDHRHDIGATQVWYQQVCQAIDTALGKKVEAKFKSFPRLQQLISTGQFFDTGTGLVHCPACGGLHDARIMLGQLKSRITETDLLSNFTIAHLIPFQDLPAPDFGPPKSKITQFRERMAEAIRKSHDVVCRKTFDICVLSSSK